MVKENYNISDLKNDIQLTVDYTKKYLGAINYDNYTEEELLELKYLLDKLYWNIK